MITPLDIENKTFSKQVVSGYNVEEVKEFMATIIKLKPTAAKGTYVKSVYLSTTMSPGIKVDPKTVDEI